MVFKPLEVVGKVLEYDIVQLPKSGRLIQVRSEKVREKRLNL